MSLTRADLVELVDASSFDRLMKNLALVFLNTLSDDDVAALGELIETQIAPRLQAKGLEGFREFLVEFGAPPELIDKVMAYAPRADAD